MESPRSLVNKSRRINLLWMNGYRNFSAKPVRFWFGWHLITDPLSLYPKPPFECPNCGPKPSPELFLAPKDHSDLDLSTGKRSKGALWKLLAQGSTGPAKGMAHDLKMLGNVPFQKNENGPFPGILSLFPTLAEWYSGMSLKTGFQTWQRSPRGTKLQKNKP